MLSGQVSKKCFWVLVTPYSSSPSQTNSKHHLIPNGEKIGHRFLSYKRIATILLLQLFFPHFFTISSTPQRNRISTREWIWRKEWERESFWEKVFSEFAERIRCGFGKSVAHSAHSRVLTFSTVQFLVLWEIVVMWRECTKSNRQAICHWHFKPG